MNDDLPVPVEPRRLPTVMAWLTIAARSFAVAAVAGAGQLGAAQALGMLSWSPAPPPDSARRQLIWLVFIFAASVLAGVAGGRRSVRAVRRAIATRRATARATRRSGAVAVTGPVSHRRPTMPARNRIVDAARAFLAGASRVSATLFASLGAAVAFPLIWLPARDTLDRTELHLLAMAAGLGIAVGSVVSLLSLAAAPVAAIAAMWLGGGWIFGLASIATVIAANEQPSTPLLGVLDIPHLIGPDGWWLLTNAIVAVAVVFAGAVAALARWVGERRLAVALSGLAGPSIVAAGYLFVGRSEDLENSYVAALLAVAAGLLTSLATAMLPRRRPEKATPVPVAPVAPPPPAGQTMIEDNEWDQPTLAAPREVPRPTTPVPLPIAAPALLAPASAPTATPVARDDTDEDPSRWARRLNRETKRLGKREREHVDWVKHLVSIPPDPTLLTREK